MLHELEINTEVTRKNNPFTIYKVTEKKTLNNIIHYTLKSKNSGAIIISEYAINRDYTIKGTNKSQSFLLQFRRQVRKYFTKK